MKIIYNICGLVIVAEDGGASLIGTLKTTCPYCKKVDCTCHFDPDIRSYDAVKEANCISLKSYNDTMDGIEALLIALAGEGVNIATKEFETAMLTVQEAADYEHF